MDFTFQLQTESGTYPPLFDAECTYREQLPRKFIAQFEPIGADAVATFFVKMDGTREQLGDPLRDTTRVKDGYGRYHDAAHLCMCLLGWCLHLRQFLKLKRKSIPILDECEDNAQANIADESTIFALINKCRRDGLTLDKPEDVPNELVTFAKLQYFGKELESVSDFEWQQVFVCMYKILELLRANNGGFMYINLLKRTVSYSKTLNLAFYD